MNRQKIESAVASGMAFVCATCRKYWIGMDRGLGRCVGRVCGSPMKGMTFPEYAGILTPERFSDWCFACGAKSEYGVLVRGMTRMCGICERHLVLLHPRNHDTTPDVLLRRPQAMNGSGTVTIAKFFGPQRRTLIEEIYEVERYFADKEGRPLVQDADDTKDET